MARSERLVQEEDIQQDIWGQLLVLLQESKGSKLFSSILCIDEGGKHVDPLDKGRFACVNYISQILRLVDEDLWKNSPGTWMRIVEWDLKTSGWYPIPLEKAIAGDIVIWDFFQSPSDIIAGSKGNQHIGFKWHSDSAMSMSREEPDKDESARSPQIHPLYFDGPNRVDGPRSVLSVWTHPKLRASYERNN